MPLAVKDRGETENREDSVALMRWADDGGYCPPEPDVAVELGVERCPLPAVAAE